MQCNDGWALTGAASEYHISSYDRTWSFRCSKIDTTNYALTRGEEGVNEEKTCNGNIRYCNKEGRVHRWVKATSEVIIGIHGQW